MKTLEEKREYDRVRMAEWLKKHPEARERNRIRNIEWRNNNREKCCRATANWRAKNPKYESIRKLKERYDITPEKYQELLLQQGNCCAICGNEETARHNRSNKIQKLAVDHCHVTGNVRGLLCQDCNRGISRFHDDPTRLENAIKYLIRGSS